MSVHPDGATLRDLDALAPDRRAEVLDHVAACSRCRDAFVADDPARVFALLKRRPIPEAILDEVTAGVIAGIDAGASAPARRFGPGNARVWAWGAVAAAVILAVALVLVPRTESPAPETAVAEAGLDAAPRSTVTVIDSPGDAQLVDLTVGETQVVMIFDREMDL
ncbi:MAG: hypothetical protein R3344_08925 [Acidobacteriota bacterium]|nr:hypothetical protein [Acidobacteriota bacterium]